MGNSTASHHPGAREGVQGEGGKASDEIMNDEC